MDYSFKLSRNFKTIYVIVIVNFFGLNGPFTGCDLYGAGQINPNWIQYISKTSKNSKSLISHITNKNEHKNILFLILNFTTFFKLLSQTVNVINPQI